MTNPNHPLFLTLLKGNNPNDFLGAVVPLFEPTAFVGICNVE
jgi:hypothetical protein